MKRGENIEKYDDEGEKYRRGGGGGGYPCTFCRIFFIQQSNLSKRLSLLMIYSVLISQGSSKVRLGGRGWAWPVEFQTVQKGLFLK